MKKQERTINLSYHGYELQSTALLGARAQSTMRIGALLRAELDNGAVGYADIHPWTELGDLPLPAQLDGLRLGKLTALTRGSLAFARLDSEARAINRSLWDGLTIPPSHFLLPGLSDGQGIAEAALAEGFTHFKVKVGKDLAAEKKLLVALGAMLGSVRLANGLLPKLRLDYNETLTPTECADYLASLESLGAVVDFIEDPCPFDAPIWATLSAQSGFSFAVDRAAITGAVLGDSVVIHKPALSGLHLPVSSMPKKRVIVTSYLDHPVGQLCAAWVAARLPKSMAGETHGLVSHRVYAPNEFSEQLGWSGPVLRVPEGHGFGFDTLLKSLPWKALT